VTDDGFMGPPWQMDWTLKAQAARDSLPPHMRETVDAARAELVTATDPYFRGIDADVRLPEGMMVRPVQSNEPKGARIFLFDAGHGWMIYSFIRRTQDPQIVVEELFWH
jgi:hypothetical protein